MPLSGHRPTPTRYLSYCLAAAAKRKGRWCSGQRGLPRWARAGRGSRSHGSERTNAAATSHLHGITVRADNTVSHATRAASLCSAADQGLVSKMRTLCPRRQNAVSDVIPCRTGYTAVSYGIPVAWNTVSPEPVRAYSLALRRQWPGADRGRARRRLAAQARSTR